MLRKSTLNIHVAVVSNGSSGIAAGISYGMGERPSDLPEVIVTDVIENQSPAEDAGKGPHCRKGRGIYNTRCFLFTDNDLVKFTEEEPEYRELILSVGHPASYNGCFGQESGWLPRNHYWFVIGRYGSELLGYWKREDPEIYSQIVEQARTRMGFIRRIIEELGEEPLFAVLDEDHKINDIDRAFIIDVGISDCSFDEGEEPPEFDFSVDTFYRFRKS